MDTSILSHRIGNPPPIPIFHLGILVSASYWSQPASLSVDPGIVGTILVPHWPPFFRYITVVCNGAAYLPHIGQLVVYSVARKRGIRRENILRLLGRFCGPIPFNPTLYPRFKACSVLLLSQLNWDCIPQFHSLLYKAFVCKLELVNSRPPYGHRH